MTSLIDKALSCVGLMRVAEHDKVKRLSELDKSAMERAFRLRNDWEAKFKRAATDLAAQAEEIKHLTGWKSTATIYAEDIAKLNAEADRDNDTIAAMQAEIASLRPDALAMRRKRQMDRDRGKKGVGK